jgi:hypothetical protein
VTAELILFILFWPAAVTASILLAFASAHRERGAQKRAAVRQAEVDRVQHQVEARLKALTPPITERRAEPPEPH